jgi:quercetin dioxygenase-like cupin family protein
MQIMPKQPTGKGPTDWFTGDVWIDSIARHPEPSHVSVGSVHFAPGARTAWHSHDGGQTLYVLEGRGRVQSRGDRIVEVAPGDMIYTPDGEEHWHGAAPDHFLTHLSITDGAPHWGDHVADAEYHGSHD